MKSSLLFRSGYLSLGCLSLGLLLTPLCYGGPQGKKSDNQSGITTPRADLNAAVLAEFDADENGKLSRKERSQFVKAMRSGTIQSENLNSMLLENFDRNNNGTLERKEIGQMRRRPNNRPNSQQTFGQFGNGGNQFGTNNRGNRQNRADMMAQFDTNGDGVLDESERQAAREAMRPTGALGAGGMCEGGTEGSGEGAESGQQRRRGRGPGQAQQGGQGGQAGQGGFGNGGQGGGGGAAFGGGRGGGRRGR